MLCIGALHERKIHDFIWVCVFFSRMISKYPTPLRQSNTTKWENSKGLLKSVYKAIWHQLCNYIMTLKLHEGLLWKCKIYYVNGKMQLYAQSVCVEFINLSYN